MFRFLKITMLDCVYVRATSTERRYIACTGLKWLSLKPWGIALKFLFLHHENILFPND